MKQWPLIRDVALFFGGLLGVYYEAVFRTAERPTLLLVFAAMMGLPLVIRSDEKKNGS
jgi:hypothetical protein